MNTKILFASLASVVMLAPMGTAITVPSADDALELMPWLAFECTDDGPFSAEFADPLSPGTTVHVFLACAGGAGLDGHFNTDCAGDSYSFWAGVTTSPRVYTYAQKTEDGLSMSAITSAWNGANTAWDQQVSASLFGTPTTGGDGKNVGRGDGVNQVGFKRLGGTTLAVQYAWTSGGVVVESDSGYNTQATWSTNGASGTYDLQGVAAQEFGHGYGLGHSDTSSASQCLTMYPYGSSGDTSKRTLGDGDIAGIKARYT